MSRPTAALGAVVVAGLVGLLMLAGCAAAPVNRPIPAAAQIPGLDESVYVPTVIATCPIPAGWQPQPLKVNSRHTHQVWISPSGTTAYGVIHIKLPWPIGPDLVLLGFLDEMRKMEGSADLLEQSPDAQGIRFVVDGGRYHMHVQLIARGWEAWAFYSATLRADPVVHKELQLAELAVAHTQIGDTEPPIRQARAGEE